MFENEEKEFECQNQRKGEEYIVSAGVRTLFNVFLGFVTRESLSRNDDDYSENGDY